MKNADWRCPLVLPVVAMISGQFLIMPAPGTRAVGSASFDIAYCHGFGPPCVFLFFLFFYCLFAMGPERHRVAGDLDRDRRALIWLFCRSTDDMGAGGRRPSSIVDGRSMEACSRTVSDAWPRATPYRPYGPVPRTVLVMQAVLVLRQLLRRCWRQASTPHPVPQVSVGGVDRHGPALSAVV